jgi:hypothetical protein
MIKFYDYLKAGDFKGFRREAFGIMDSVVESRIVEGVERKKKEIGRKIASKMVKGYG